MLSLPPIVAWRMACAASVYERYYAEETTTQVHQKAQVERSAISDMSSHVDSVRETNPLS